MFKILVASLSALVIGGVPLALPVLAKDASAPIAQAVKQPQVNLTLSAEKRILKRDKDQKIVVSWQPLSEGKALVQPGDVLRYTVIGKNVSSRPAAKFTITQPIPQKTTFVLKSAQGVAAISYSLDQAATFSPAPTVQVQNPDGTTQTKPAPAEQYTHVRWVFGQALAPKAQVKAVYEVKVN